MGILLDLAVIIFILLSYLIMSKKGFMKALSSISSNILTIILVAILITPATEALSKTPLGDTIRETVETHIIKKSDDNKNNKEDNESQESIIAPEIMNKVKEKGDKLKTNIISGILMRIVTLVILVIAIKLILWILFMILGTIVKIPVISWFNKFAGGIIGIVNSLLIIFIVCGLSSLNMGIFHDLRELIDQTFILKFLTTNNLLMNIFIH